MHVCTALEEMYVTIPEEFYEKSHELGALGISRILTKQSTLFAI